MLIQPEAFGTGLRSVSARDWAAAAPGIKQAAATARVVSFLMSGVSTGQAVDQTCSVGGECLKCTRLLGLSILVSTTHTRVVLKSSST